MSLCVLNLDERAGEWEAALEALPSRLRDVYFSSAYHLLWQRNGDGRAMGAVFENGSGRLLYPFLWRNLADVSWLGSEYAGLHDITSAYGYGGPLVWATDGDRDALVEAFCVAFSAWCVEHGVVSEFVRFHPLLHTEEGCEAWLTPTPSNVTVVCRLGDDPQQHLAALSQAARRNVRKAQRAGLVCAVEEGEFAYEEFARLYAATMQRRDAAEFYLFPPRHFADFRTLLGRRQALLAVRRQKRMVAAALFMYSEHFAHYHLGASDASALDLRPNNLLFFEAVNWAGRLGLEELHLGGGYRAGGDDELLRFKAGFSPVRSRFFLGRAVHMQEQYEAAARARATQGPITGAGFFPAYRAPLSP